MFSENNSIAMDIGLRVAAAGKRKHGKQSEVPDTQSVAPKKAKSNPKQPEPVPSAPFVRPPLPKSRIQWVSGIGSIRFVYPDTQIGFSESGFEIRTVCSEIGTTLLRDWAK
jgi:hypothetical protein